MGITTVQSATGRPGLRARWRAEVEPPPGGVTAPLSRPTRATLLLRWAFTDSKRKLNALFVMFFIGRLSYSRTIFNFYLQKLAVWISGWKKPNGNFSLSSLELETHKRILRKKILVWANNVEDILIRIGNKTLLIGKCDIHLKYEYFGLSANNQRE